MKTFFNLLLILALAVFAARARAQDEVPPPMPAAPLFSDAQLQQLVGPIALYPDPLIAVMLPAATLPTEIVMADRYISGGGDINEIDQQGWDPNVQALAHYPAVLKWMDDNLNWTTQLGQAFQNQQQDLMTAVQELRTQAYNLGNLQSTPQQQVVNDNGYIEILPANPDDVYIPDYQGDQVYYDQPVSVPFVTFSVGYAIGPWLCGDFDWRNHHLLCWDRDHPRPSGWWQKRPDERATFIAAGHAPVWNGANRRPIAPAFQGDRGYNTPVSAQRANGFIGVPAAHDVRNSYNNNLPWTAQAPNSREPQRPQFQQQPQHPQQQYPQQQAQRPQQQPQFQQPHFETPPPPPNNAFIGIQSARDTRDYSDRGEHSMETMPQFRDLGGFHGGGSPPPSGGEFHGGAPSGGEIHGGAPSGGGGGGGGRSEPPQGGGGGGGRR